jgi:Leucine-rich repeat (LRR) protein
LYLDNNRVRSIQGIDVLKALSTLSLSHNAIEDLAPLQGLTGLSYLFLENNRIRDLTPLIEMAKKDFEGEKRFAPFLNIYLKGNRVKRADASRLAAVGPRLND